MKNRLAIEEKNADIDHFNSRAATYETARSQGYFFDRVQRRVLELAKRQNQPEAILDVGCGTGRLLRKAKLQWESAKLIGVDAAQKMIEQATQLFPDAEFHVSMAEALPLADKSVDLVFSTLSFHHWANQAKGISEVARVLRPNGLFILADITVPSWIAQFVKIFKNNSPAKINNMFTKAGFIVETQQRPWSWFRSVIITIGVKP